MNEAIRVEDAGIGDTVHVTVSGRYVSVGVKPMDLVNRGPRAKRGLIKGYSAGSMRRFAERLGALAGKWDGPVLWFTGTFSTKAAPGVQAAGRVWRLTWRDVQARHPEAYCLWKREFTRAGTIHYHAFVFGVPSEDSDGLDGERQAFRDSWCAWSKAYGCYVPAMERASTSLEWWRGGSDRCVYALKEAGKGIGATHRDGESIGRSWGIRNRKAYWRAVDEAGGERVQVGGDVNPELRAIGKVAQDVVVAEMSKRVRGVMRSLWAVVPAAGAVMVADVLDQVSAFL